jgi:2-C-methyl-D-erythritol 4-phosphate cytidylyltransferase
MSPPPPSSAVIVAAGNSTRMELQGGERKPFLLVNGKTVLEHTMAAFDACPGIHDIVVVAQEEDIQRIKQLAQGKASFNKLYAVVQGGAERTDSVRLGVEACPDSSLFVAIHDGARLCIQPSTITSALECAQREGAALVAIPVQDTIKRSPSGERATQTLRRSELWAAQTPQVFRRDEILDLLERGAPEGEPATDDAALYEHWIGPIPIVPGDSSNLKLTTPTDLEIVSALLRLREEQRTPR